MLSPLFVIALLGVFGKAVSSPVFERDLIPYGSIDGIHVPSTTDLPAPETTDKTSDVASSYAQYIEVCGKFLQNAAEGALTEYKTLFNSSIDINSPDFIVWAANNYQVYRAEYLTCQSHEFSYQSILSTFIPDTTFATSTGPTGSPVASIFSSQQSTTAPGNGSGAEPSKGSAAAPLKNSAISPCPGMRAITLGIILFVTGWLN
ncbi:hypothetical protein C8R46DRAFT_1040017 [Mycena filopes]|nr:hypothetical protein C8R46DRAFT_1040017 [Mycena filopes]